MMYPIHERFATFQGEGLFMGMAAFFVRTYGCPVHCPWCDSAGTWHHDWVPKGIEKLSAEALVVEAQEAKMAMMVVTGGEPTILDLEPLTSVCHHVPMQVHLETSGGFVIRGSFDWITLSPKRWKLPLRANVALANEIKIVVENPEDIDCYYSILLDLGLADSDCCEAIWLHPEWSKQRDPIVLNAISAAVKREEGIFRAGWQIHKLYRVDALDPGSRPLVPLGGDSKLGY